MAATNNHQTAHFTGLGTAIEDARMNCGGVKRTIYLIVVCLLAMSESLAAQGRSTFSAGTIVAREVGAWFFADGVMKPESATFELTYEVRDSSVVRRTVRKLANGEVTTDATEYFFVTSVVSFTSALEALKYRRLTDDQRASAPTVRAIGRPGLDAVEILQIGPDFVQSVKTVRDYMTLSRYVRSQ